MASMELLKTKNHLKSIVKQSKTTTTAKVTTTKKKYNRKLKRIVENYKRTFAKTSISKLDNILMLGLKGVPFYAWCFKGYNVTDLMKGKDYVQCTNLEYQEANYYERYHVGEYFKLPIFHKDILKTTKYDHILFAIISVMLKWNDKSLYKFANEYLNGSTKMISALIEERNRDNSNYVYSLLPQTVFKYLRVNLNEIDPFYLNKFKNYDIDYEEEEEENDDDNDDDDDGKIKEDGSLMKFVNTLKESIYTTEILFLMSSIKIIKCWFLEEDPVELEILSKKTTTTFHDSTIVRNDFDWFTTIPREFVDELKLVYQWLREDSFDADKIAFIEKVKPIPCQLKNICDNVEDLKGTSNLKFITGQACCGKTTMLDYFRSLGWKIYNRGKLGSFGGKANDPAAIANLHAAIQYKLTESDVIGDRGSIDNPLWSFIMPACDPSKCENLIGDLLAFINSTFNELSIAEYITQKGVVFLDPYPKLNQQRMLERCTGGDPHRGRLTMYNLAQFISYYAVARLFGWKCYAVPYTVNRVFNPEGYAKIASEVEKIFGPPKITDNKFIWFNKPKNDFVIDNNYPKAVGIFK